MNTQITEAEILEALAVANAGPSDARTLNEIAAASGIGERRVHRALLAFKAEGRLSVHRVTREGIDGRRTSVPGYTITPAPKRKRG
jgi:alkylated DNA nucleotide flippase Atl1